MGTSVVHIEPVCDLSYRSSAAPFPQDEDRAAYNWGVGWLHGERPSDPLAGYTVSVRITHP